MPESDALILPHRLRIIRMDECAYRAGPQTPEHILQHCPALQDAQPTTLSYAGRDPRRAEVREKLWGYRPEDRGLTPCIHLR